MRNLEAIEKDLSAAREALSSVEGTPAEVYSRIVGYYRSVRNWNKGKREEYGERRLYRLSDEHQCATVRQTDSLSGAAGLHASASPAFSSGMMLLLFTRALCPGCTPAKSQAEKLGIPVAYVNTDTADGMAEAARHNVMSTPTAILLSPGGEEMGRALDADTISKLAAVPSPIPIAG